MYKLTKNEINLAIIFAVLGFIFSTRSWILWLDELTPLSGLLVYYIVLFLTYMLLSKVGLSVAHIEIKNVAQIIGLTLITFAFFIIIDWTSVYVQHVTGKPVDALSNVFLQDEDGSVFYLWNTIVGMNMEISRIFSFVITPFILTMVGGFLVTKPKLLW